MKYETIDLKALRQSVSIVDLARSLGIEIRGKQARCYNGNKHAHNDKSFSLGFDVDRNRFKCFGCGENGSVIDLYSAVKSVPVSMAIRALSSHVSTGFSATRNEDITKVVAGYHPSNKSVPIDRIEPYNAISSDIYAELIAVCGGLDDFSRKYLTGSTRALTDKTINHFKLFSINDYQKVNTHLKKNFSEDTLKCSGLMSDKGNLIFFNRIIIPFFRNGLAVFLKGRALNDHPLKYMNLKDVLVPLFNTDTLLGMKPGERVYLCEGEFDAMILEQYGYKAVAISGANNLKDWMIDLFKGLEVVLCMDNDDAGRRAMDEIGERFARSGHPVKAKILPDGIKDVTEYFLVNLD